MNKAYRFLQVILRPFYRLFHRLTVVGRENEPQSGACLICANHISNHDVFMIAAALKRQISFFAKKELFDNKLTRWFVKGLGAIPVNRGTVDLHSIRACLDVLKNGGYIGIFPQGTRMPDVTPSPADAKSGVGLLAFRAKSSVLPIFIETKNHRIRLFRRTRLIIGKRISYDELGFTKGGMAEYDRASQSIFCRICELGQIPVGENNGN